MEGSQGTNSIQNFLSPSSSSVSAKEDVTPIATSSTRAASATVQQFVTKEETMKAEIIWNLKLNDEHWSYNSCSNIDVELESENSQTSNSPGATRKNITLKLKSEKTSTSGTRGRPRKSGKSNKKDEDQYPSEEDVVETPIFKTLETGEPLHHNKKLHWDHKVNLIGEKVVDPLIHCCEKCSLPILIYGRMIQCKHVFCFTCAKKTEKKCPRCGDPVQRIEQSALGTVFLCTYGGSKHGVNGCRRTYLSQRDLNAHIGHRHLKHEMIEQASKAPTSTTQRATAAVPKPAPQPQPSQTIPNPQQLLEQFTAAVRQATANVAAMPQRSSQEEPYQQGPMPHLQHPPAMSSHQQMMPHSFPGAPMQGMPPLSAAQSVMGQPQLATSVPSENYPSSIPVLGNRIKTLISVPIQEDEYKQQGPGFHGMPPSGGMPPPGFPPPGIGQYPVGSMAPGMHHQHPPGIPPMYSNPSMPGGPMPNPLHAGQMSQSMPAGMPHGPPPPMSTGQIRGPPARMGGPPGGPPPRFFDGAGPRGPWPPGGPGTGPPPRGPAPPSSSQPRPPRPPQADYNYY